MARTQIRFGIDIQEPPLNTPVPPRGGDAKERPDYPFLDTALDSMQRQECDFICLPLMQGHDFEPFGSSQRILEVMSWCTMVVGKVSTWTGSTVLDCDSPDQEISLLSCHVLRREIEYAGHSTLPAVMIDLPEKASPNLARILISSLLKAMYLQIWVRVPLCNDPNNSQWLAWNSLRTMCHNHSRLHVVLDASPDLPSETVIRRWLAEPIRALMLDVSLFQSYGDNCHLSQKHHELLMTIHRHNTQIIFRGDISPQLQQYNADLRFFRNYIVNMRETMTYTDQEKEEMPFQDYLQAPLQPLMDNLESQTYEVFERDPVKYEKYEEATALALQDLMAKEGAEKTFVVMVVGAGRGPLVKSSLQAAKRMNANIKVYAVEKNPNAIITLKGLLREKDWEGKVEIVYQDMRNWDAPEQADLMISELLGSFGDNELSPECLDGAERFLKKGGVMIPESYRSYFAPLQSHKLHTDVLAYDDLTHIETPYVVKIHAGHLVTPVKQCFEFIHPKPPLPYPQSNDRNISVDFEIKEDALCHGFAGYFDATLYKDVEISIHPERFSEGMFSWFSIYFPIKTPLLLRKGDKLTVVFWRVCGTAKVWYEWCVASPSPVAVHNPNGRSYWVGL